MNRCLLIITVIFLSSSNLASQVANDYDPSIQKTRQIQYFKPVETHLFTGDCMPYFHDGTLYLYWLLDQGHHSGLGGLGGHQWALSTSKDLIDWKHYPVAISIDEDREKSICTGSVIFDKDRFYAFYSTRIKENGQVQEQLSYAVSTDGGIHFEKQKPNPFYLPPKACQTWDFRDPKVFKDETGLFPLFISGYLKEPEVNGYGGYLVHLTSPDLKKWEEAPSPLKGQRATPECSDYFKWNGWYYLLYSIGSETYYLKSRNAFGPWEYPESQALIESWANVYKTAEFTNGRRIAVAFIPGKKENKDHDGEIFGGNILFRELVQQRDGTLNTRFLPEVLPTMTELPDPVIQMNSANNTFTSKGYLNIDAFNEIGIASLPNLPDNYRLSAIIDTKGNYDEFGLFLRATDKQKTGYKLALNNNKGQVSLQNTLIEAVDGLSGSVQLDVIVNGDFIDVCINNKRCIINRLAEQKGKNLFFFVKNGNITIKSVKIQKIQ